MDSRTLGFSTALPQEFGFAHKGCETFANSHKRQGIAMRVYGIGYQAGVAPGVP